MALTRDYKWILIDLDNTLVASNPARLKFYFIFYFIFHSRKQGLSIRESLVLLKLMKKALYEKGHLSNIQRVSHSIGQSSLKTKIGERQIQAVLTQTFFSMKKEFSAIAGATELIHKLKQKSQVVLATNPIWPLAVTEMRLALIGLQPSDFALITHNENMATVKPDPEYFQELLTKLKISADECVMIGDNPLKDGVAALAKIRTILVDKNKPLLSQLDGIVL